MLYIFTQHYFRQEVEQRAPLLNHTYRHIPRKKTTLQPCPLSFRNMYKFRRTINSAILRIPHYGVAIALISRNCLIFLRGDKFGRYFKPRCWKARMVFFSGRYKISRVRQSQRVIITVTFNESEQKNRFAIFPRFE